MEACLLAVGECPPAVRGAVGSGGMSTGCQGGWGLWRDVCCLLGDVHWLSGRLWAVEGCLLAVGGMSTGCGGQSECWVLGILQGMGGFQAVGVPVG